MLQTMFAMMLVRIIFRLVSGAVEWVVVLASVLVVGALAVGRWLVYQLWRGCQLCSCRAGAQRLALRTRGGRYNIIS